MKRSTIVVLGLIPLLIAGAVWWRGRLGQADEPGRRWDAFVISEASRNFLNGKQIFRFDTFGSEAFWGDALHLHQAIAGAANGGVGPGLSPAQALALGLKVDVDAIPADILQGVLASRIPVNLNDPAATLALLRLNAILGLTGFFNADGSIRSLGIQCALCHSVVDDSVAPGVGHRLDGWANRDLDVGKIVALAPNLGPIVSLLQIANPAVDDATVRAVLSGWGPGKFDAGLFLDGKATNPVTGMSAATLIPPAFGLAGVNLHTWTGWGSVTHWNAFVANLEMHGQGRFFDPRLADAAKFPIAAAAHFDDVTPPPGGDHITSKLAALHLYQLALPTPPPPAGTFDPAAAGRGSALFTGKADCARCHVPPLFTEPGWNMHTPAEIGIEPFQADRAPDGRYRTSPLRGLWTHQKGGFFHDGRFPNLAEVVAHYNSHFALGLTGPEMADLVEFLKSI